MTALRKQLISVEEFYAWAVQQPGKWELYDGVPTSTAPERAIHGDTKYRLARTFDAALNGVGTPCRFVLDSMAVPIGESNSYQPDLMVYCGEVVPDPIIVVEVLSASTRRIDIYRKLAEYFRLPSVRHYLIFEAEQPLLIHHSRSQDDTILTRIIRNGAVSLDPPGIEIDLQNIYEAERSADKL